MPDPNCPSSRWSLDSLYEHITRVLEELTKRFEQRFADQEKAVTAAITAADRAVSKAETASEKRFEAVNEFRAQQRDLIETFARQDALNGAEQKIERTISRLDTLEGRTAGISAGWVYLIGLVSLGASLVGMVGGLIALTKH